MHLLAAMLLSAAPAPSASPPPAPQARASAVARVRILSPVQIRQVTTPAVDARRDPLVTHRAKRRDGAQVIDAY
jgi:hypothetical protein